MRKFIVEKEFEHEGFKCVVLFGYMGTRNGYVGIPSGHPYYGKGYSEVDDVLEAHGGLTYSGGNKEYPIQSNLWWFGFDCAHWGDGQDLDRAMEVFPEHKDVLNQMKLVGKMFDPGDPPRSLSYVEMECRSLAEQLSRIK